MCTKLLLSKGNFLTKEIAWLKQLWLCVHNTMSGIFCDGKENKKKKNKMEEL